MFAYVGLVCLVVISSTQAEYTYKIMDMKVPQFTTPTQCPFLCNNLMKWGLTGVDLVFTHLIKNLQFSAGFCECGVQGLGKFNFTSSCTGNDDGTIYDHKVRLEFNKPQANCKCPIPKGSAAAAEKINGAFSPEGKCGKDGAGNKMAFEPVKGCGDDAGQSDSGEPMEIEAIMENPVFETVLRVDTRNPEVVYPTEISLTFQEEHIFKLKGGSDFQNTFDCLTKNDNKVNFYRKLIYNIYKPIFDCLDENNEHSRSIIDTILYYTGNCNNFNVFG